MKTQWIRSAGIVLFAIVLSAGMMAQPRFRNGQGEGRIAQKPSLDLTDEQKEEVKSLRIEHHKVLKPMRNKMVELKARERTLLSEEKVDLKKVNDVIDEQTELLNQIRKLQVEHRLEMKTVFTDEQLMKLEQRRNLRKHRRTEGNGFHNRPGRGRTFQKNLG